MSEAKPFKNLSGRTKLNFSSSLIHSKKFSTELKMLICTKTSVSLVSATVCHRSPIRLCPSSKFRLSTSGCTFFLLRIVFQYLSSSSRFLDVNSENFSIRVIYFTRSLVDMLITGLFVGERVIRNLFSSIPFVLLVFIFEFKTICLHFSQFCSFITF